MTIPPTPTEAEKVVAELRDVLTDWDGADLPDAELPRVDVLCGTLRRAAALIESQGATIESLRRTAQTEAEGAQRWLDECATAEARVTALEAEKAGYIATLVEADATLTGEDAFALDPIVGSHNPHENAAGLVRAAVSSTEVKNDG